MLLPLEGEHLAKNDYMSWAVFPSALRCSSVSGFRAPDKTYLVLVKRGQLGHALPHSTVLEKINKQNWYTSHVYTFNKLNG